MGIDLVIADGVATLTLDNPKRRNALTDLDARDLAAAVDGIHDQAAVLLLIGRGEAFCAGADLETIRSAAGAGSDAMRTMLVEGYQAAVRSLASFDGIAIAAVDGPAVGFGVELSLACDVRYIGAAGWMEHGWRRLGVVSGAGGAWLATRRASEAAGWALLTARAPLEPNELERLGLGSAVQGRAEPVARDVAKRLAELPPAVIRAHADLIRGAKEETLARHLERCVGYQAELVKSADFGEKISTILEKTHNRG